MSQNSLETQQEDRISVRSSSQPTQSTAHFLTVNSSLGLSARQRPVPSFLFLILFASMVALESCAALPQFGQPVHPEVVEPFGRDTLRVEVPDPDTWPIATGATAEPPRQTTTPLRKPTRAPIPEPEDPAATDMTEVSPDPTETTPSSQPAITVSPPKVELEQLETEVIADISQATKLIDQIKQNQPAVSQDKLGTIHSMISQAREALSNQDVQAAAGLARKARLLAVELTSS